MKLSCRQHRGFAFKCCLLILSSAATGPAGEYMRGPADASPRASALDVTLDSGQRLSGQVVDAQGVPVAGVSVYVVRGGRVCQVTESDRAGIFSVPRVEAGMAEVGTRDSLRLCRIWTAGSAPPAARQGLLFVAGDAVRGQCNPCGARCVPAPGCSPPTCGYQPGVGAGFFGGGLSRAFSNPWFVSGVAAAAIAIPIATLHDDDDAS
jgi:hypothetical protein